jgi:DNA-binding MarR family transcriptional regulator
MFKEKVVKDGESAEQPEPASQPSKTQGDKKKEVRTRRFLMASPIRKAVLLRLNESEEGLNQPNLRDELRKGRGAIDHAIRELEAAKMVIKEKDGYRSFYLITAEGRELLRRFGAKRCL